MTALDRWFDFPPDVVGRVVGWGAVLIALAVYGSWLAGVWR